MSGGDGEDTLVGDAPDGLRGGGAVGGNDTLEGGESSDVMLGFFGEDLFRGGAGPDRLFGGDGVDTSEEDDPADVLDSIENLP